MIIFLSIILSVCSVVLGSPLYAAAAVMALLLYIASLKRDLNLVDEGVIALVDKDGSMTVPPPAEAFTEQGQDILDRLFGLSFRVASLQSDSGIIRTDTKLVKQDVRVDDFSLDDFFEEILDFIQSKFRCKSVAITFKRSSLSDWQVMTNGIAGDRFYQKLKNICSSLATSENVAFGLRDGFEEESLVSEFSLFGVRYSIIYPFRESNELGVRGIIWLGYDETKVPTNTEQLSAQGISDFISLQLNTKSKVSDLHFELRRIKNDTKQKSQFFADLSHDVRSPLSNIKNILALIKFEESSPETHKMIESAMDNCDHMADILEDILYYSQYQVGELRASIKEVGINSILDRLTASFEASAKIKGLNLVCQLPDQELVVDVDVRHLRRIVSNLLSNAIKYTQKGTITVSLKQSLPGSCSIVVADTGIGLASNELSQLFTPFTRFDRTGAEGVGLGLALSKILAGLNGLEIKVNSAPGKGSSFELVFKSATIRSGRDLNKLNTKVTPINKNNQKQLLFPDAKILLVDDDLDYLDSTAGLLRSICGEVITAKDISEGLTHLVTAQPSLLISDNTMHDGNSDRVVKTALQMGIPVIVISGHEPSLLLANFAQVGLEPTMILRKPVGPDELINVVVKILGGRLASLSRSTS